MWKSNPSGLQHKEQRNKHYQSGGRLRDNPFGFNTVSTQITGAAYNTIQNIESYVNCTACYSLDTLLFNVVL